jgi:hypothetical protein
MAKAGQRTVDKKTEQTKKRAKIVAEGGKTRAASLRSGRSGSDSSASAKTRGH